MRTLALAIVALLFVVNCSASLPADCEDVTYETRQVEVLVECIQVVPVTNCVEETVSFSMPIDSTAEAGDKPAPDGAEPGEKQCKEPETQTLEATVLVQCTDLVIRTTLEPRLVSYDHPINSPNCEQQARRVRVLNRSRTGSLPVPAPVVGVSVNADSTLPTYVGTVIDASACQPCQPSQGCNKCGFFH